MRNKIEIKRVLTACWICFVCLGPLQFLYTSHPAEGHPGTVSIVVVKEMGIPAYDTAAAGFREILEKENITAHVKTYDYKDKHIIPRIKSQHPDLILTVGSTAGKLVSEAIKDIPIVFTMVMDPDFRQITSKNMAGVSLEIPVKIKLEYLRRVVPAFKRVGVIYNQPENEIIVKEAQQLAAELGLILKPFPIRSLHEIPKIRDLNVDILWMIPDYIMSQPPIIRRMLLSSIREKIPLTGYSRNYARGGALLALSCDYKDVGRQSGEIAVNILKGEDYPGPAARSPRKIKLYLNQIVAERLGIKFSKKIIKRADEIFR